MGTITSGIGLVSGINTSQIIDQLMKLEQQPVDNLKARIDAANQQKLALVGLSTSLASIKLNTTTLKKPSTFTAAKATSSNESVLTATTTGSPTPGTYQFQVARLVTTQQAVSNGFGDYSTSPVGAGTITIEQGGGEVSSQVALSQLNGGAGVRRGQFRITDRSGHSAVVDISAAVTLDDVVKKINTTFDVSVRASISQDGLQLTDLSGGTGNISVQDVGGGSAAADLGLVQSVSGNTLTGTSINSLGRATLLSQLNDGRGVRTASTSSAADFRVSFADGSTVDVNLSSAKTLGDALDAINNAGSGKVRADIASDGHSLKLTDLTGSGGDFTVSALNGSNAAADLGIAGTGNGELGGSWVLSKLNTVLLSTLNGGKGISTGSITVTNRAGAARTIDLSGAKTVQDLLDTINNSGAGITASLKSSANGIQITDTSGGSGNLTIADDASGTLAQSLGIAGSFTTASVQGANLQRQWVSENTLLSTYNGGKGVGQGMFKITNASGVTATIDMTSTANPLRIGDVIKQINAKNIGVTASINDHGDGILLTDNSGGAGKLVVADLSGTAAADLNIKGDSGTGKTIDGSFEKTIDVTATDTLATIQTKIQTLNFGVGAQIINDGTADAPYRLSMTAKNTGLAGRVVLDMGATSIAAQNLVDAQDAAVFVGGTSGSAQPLLITASRNQIAGVINGVSIDLHSASSTPVSLDVSRTTDTAVDMLQKFTDGFNAIVDKIAELTKFDPTDPSSKGILLGDATVRSIEDGMYQALNAALKEGGRYKVLADIGLTIGDGGKLNFDSDKFNTAYATDPDAVQKLFSYLETTKDDKGKDVTTGKGLGYVLENAITKLIDPVTGLITRENQTLDSRTQGFNDRISQLNSLLDQKRLRLETQFANMESVLSQLQSQQSSLSQIKSITTTSSSSGS